MRMKERLKKLEDICKTNGFKGLSPNGKIKHDGGASQSASGSTSSQGVRKPPG